MGGRGHDADSDLTLEQRLANDQLGNARQLQRIANTLVRLAGLVLIGAVIGGVALMINKQQNPLCGFDTTGLCSDSSTYPYLGDGIAVLTGGIISAVWMALAAMWARTYATAQLIKATRILAHAHADVT
jgi:hypothetical protein